MAERARRAARSCRDTTSMRNGRAGATAWRPRLRREAGIRRRRCGRGFSYKGPDSAVIKNPGTLARMKENCWPLRRTRFDRRAFG